MERAHTDAGLTGDKIKVSDPAAAPVETDAETSGTPTSPTAMLETVRHLMREAAARPRPDTFGAWRQPDATYQRELGRIGFSWLVVVVAVGIAAGIIGLG